MIEAECNAYLASLPSPDSSWPSLVQAIVEYIHRHLFETELSVAAIRQALGLRDNNHSAPFAIYVGCRIKQYIAVHRLTMAKRLLRYRELKVGEVAHVVGYPSHTAFSKAFRRAEGCTPSAHRKKFREMESSLSSPDVKQVVE